MISGDLLKIDGTTIPGIAGYKIQRAKIWKDADRNMAGDVRASLVGNYVKLLLSIRVTNQSEMASLNRLLDKDFFSVTYYDSRTQTTHTAQYYAADYEVEILNKRRGLYKPFDVNLVPVSRRVY